MLIMKELPHKHGFSKKSCCVHFSLCCTNQRPFWLSQCVICALVDQKIITIINNEKMCLKKCRIFRSCVDPKARFPGKDSSDTVEPFIASNHLFSTQWQRCGVCDKGRTCQHVCTHSIYSGCACWISKNTKTTQSAGLKLSEAESAGLFPVTEAMWPGITVNALERMPGCREGSRLLDWCHNNGQ